MHSAGQSLPAPPLADRSRKARLAAVVDWALLALGAAFVLFAFPHHVGGDGQARFAALQSVIEQGIVPAVKYPLLQPLLSTPLYLLGKLAYGPEWWVARFNPLVFLLLGLGLFRELRLRYGSPMARTFLLLLFFTTFPNHLKGYYGEVLTAALAALGALWCGRNFLAGASLLVLSVLNTPAALPALGLVALRLAWTERRLRWLATSLAALLLIMLEYWLKYGSPISSGYDGEHGLSTVLPYSGLPGFSYPFVLGLCSILFSFGKGLVFFLPGLLLFFFPDVRAAVRRGGPDLALWLWFLAGLVLAYATWWAWYGGFFWGPRFFLFGSLPAALALTLALRESEPLPGRALFALGVLLLSAWVGFDGAIPEQRGLEACTDDAGRMEYLCWYVPEFSPLWRPMIIGLELDQAERRYGLFCLLVLLRTAAPLVIRLWRAAPTLLRPLMAHARGAWRW